MRRGEVGGELVVEERRAHEGAEGRPAPDTKPAQGHAAGSPRAQVGSLGAPSESPGPGFAGLPLAGARNGVYTRHRARP
jgi:hypothetical protein